MTNELNDSLDNLFNGDTGSVRIVPVVAAPEYKTAEQRFAEGCTKCRGTGRFISYSGRALGPCFACKGAGKFEYKTSPAVRAAKREQAADRKVRRSHDTWQSFAADNQKIAEWIIANRASFEFAAKLNEAVIRYGDLTEGQRAAVERCIAREVAKATARAERVQQAPQADTAGIDRLKAAFDTAVAYSAEKGLKLSPRITIGGVTISPAKATSANPGALYVKVRGGEYLGKIAGGRFFASRECSQEQQAKVLEFVADPAQAAKVYGQTTGTCCICNATLRSEWKNKGIGPICAEKFGWA
jgi:hypothetical protein